MDKTLLIKLARMVMKFVEIKIDDKSYFIDGELAVGVEVLDENGEVLADGEYVVDGKTFKVEGGRISEIESGIEEDAIPAEPIVEEPVEETPVEEPEVKEEPEVEQEAEVEPEVEEVKEPEVEQEAELDEKDSRIKELEAIVEQKDAEIKVLEEKVKAMEEEIAKPVEETINLNRIERVEIKSGALKYFQ